MTNPPILPDCDQARHTLKKDLESRRSAGLSPLQIEQRRLLRIWNNPGASEPWTALEPDEPVIAPSYGADGNYLGMLDLNGPYFRIAQTHSHDGTVRWSCRRIRQRSLRSPTRPCRTPMRTTRARAKAISRSSSRAGDSGDADDGEPDPPLLHLWRHPSLGDISPGLWRVLLASRKEAGR